MKRTIARVVLITGVAGAVAAASARAQDTAITPMMALATFDTAWARIDRTYYDTLFLAGRWKVLRDSLRPLAAKAKTNAQLRTVLQALVGGVGVSHFGLIPRELAPSLTDPSARPAVSGGGGASGDGRGAGGGSGGAPRGPGNIGVSLRYAAGKLVVWKVDSGGPAWAQGVRGGDIVLRIDTTDATAAFTQLGHIDESSVRKEARTTAVMHANTQLSGTTGDVVTLVLERGGSARTAVIPRGPVRGLMSRVGNLPPLNAVLDVSERAVSGTNGTRRIGIIGFSVWLPVLSAGLDSAFNRLHDADGIVIDLRGNPGGFALMISYIAGHLVETPASLGSLRERATTLHINANPQVRPYTGPIAVLIDPLSGSTSEFFAAGLQAIGRVRVMGDTSAGAALPAVLDRLPNGDVMMHALADLVDAKGRRVEGVGVIPDEVVPLNVAALAAGRDDALDAALRWLTTQSRVHQD